MSQCKKPIVLHIPRDEAIKELEQWIKEAEQMLTVEITTDEEFDKAKRSFNLWTENEYEKLFRLFSREVLALGYGNPSCHSLPSNLAEETKLLKSKIEQRANIFKSLLKRVKSLPFPQSAHIALP